MNELKRRVARLDGDEGSYVEVWETREKTDWVIIASTDLPGTERGSQVTVSHEPGLGAAMLTASDELKRITGVKQ